MITEDCVNTMLPIVADSWETLRRCDVFRLLDSISYATHQSVLDAAEIVGQKRPDLRERALSDANAIISETDFQDDQDIIDDALNGRR